METLGQIQHDLGEIKGEVKGIRAALGRISDHLVHQDERIDEIAAAEGRREGAAGASQRWLAALYSLLGLMSGVIGGFLGRWLAATHP